MKNFRRASLKIQESLFIKRKATTINRKKVMTVWMIKQKNVFCKSTLSHHEIRLWPPNNHQKLFPWQKQFVPFSTLYSLLDDPEQFRTAPLRFYEMFRFLHYAKDIFQNFHNFHIKKFECHNVSITKQCYLINYTWITSVLDHF